MERELELRRERLHRLNELFRLQTERLKLLRRQHAIALHRLGDRIDRLYRQEQTDTLSLLISSTSFTDALDMFDYLHRIADEDQRIANQVGAAKKRVRHSAKRRGRRASDIARRRGSSPYASARFVPCVTVSPLLAAASSPPSPSGSRISPSRRPPSATHVAEMEALQQVSSTLAAKIQAAQAAAGTGGRLTVARQATSGRCWGR